jgi:gamma-glutamylcyclotransferase (GGCT)/AIG2-like uncharacterized protein YtfP
MRDEQTIRVFVYGTLKPGESNFDRYCAARVVEMQAAIVYGRLYDLPFGYPAMTAGTDCVYGYLLSFDDPKILLNLDELEDYQPDRSDDENEYIREKIETFSPERQPLGLAWVYRMTPEMAERLNGILLPHGQWMGRESNKQFY